MPTLLQRLRRHKGGWVLLLAALIIRVAAGTACLLDGPRPVFTSSSAPSVSLVDTVQVAATDATDGDTCLLGERGGCHCACAHAAALPLSISPLATVVMVGHAIGHLPEAPISRVASSPLRPPIA